LNYIQAAGPGNRNDRAAGRQNDQAKGILPGMRIKENFLLREIAGTFIVVPIGERVIDFKGMMMLNELGSFIWNEMQNERTFDDIYSAIMDNYDIDADTAKTDLEEFLARVRKNGALEE